MFQEFYSKSDMLAWPVVGLLIFATIFIGVLAYVFFGLRDKDKIDEISSLPLNDDEKNADGKEDHPAGENSDDPENGPENGRAR